MRPLLQMAALVLLVALPAGAQGSSVASTVHNLSVSGPGEIRSLDETEICRFCHVPHSPVVRQPLWGHALSSVAQYKTARVRPGAVDERSPQPDGSSRLCLSCHDGTVALGELGESSPTARMSGAGRLSAGRRGHIGTDLSGSHPVSIPMPESPEPGGNADMGVRARALVEADREVRLDRDGKVQCTSCHDPHADRYYDAGRVPHFFVKSSVTEACLVCHELR